MNALNCGISSRRVIRISKRINIYEYLQVSILLEEWAIPVSLSSSIRAGIDPQTTPDVTNFKRVYHLQPLSKEARWFYGGGGDFLLSPPSTIYYCVFLSGLKLSKLRGELSVLWWFVLTHYSPKTGPHSRFSENWYQIIGGTFCPARDE